MKTIPNISTPEVSFSPLFSNIGLVSPADYPGVKSLYLHYNRYSREVFDSFIRLPDGMALAPGDGTYLKWAGAGMAALLAFFDVDSFVFACAGIDALTVPGSPAGGTTDVYGVFENDRLRLKGRSANGDARDPDRYVAFSFSVDVKAGAAEYGDGKLTVKPDGNNRIELAFSFDAPDLSGQTPSVLAERPLPSPASFSDALKKSADYFALLRGALPEDDGSAEHALAVRAADGLSHNLTKAGGRLSGHISMFPNRGEYPTHFLWDTAFTNLGIEPLNADIAAELLKTLFDTRRADGKIEQFICSTWGRPDDTQPALLGWAAERLLKIRPDDGFKISAAEALYENNKWWLSQRMTRFGVISCPSGLETGQDDSPRFDNGPTLAADMNGYLLSQLHATARFLAETGSPGKSEEMTDAADRLERAILDILYDSEDNIFYDADPVTGAKIKIVGASCFVPLWAGADPGDGRAEDMIRRYLINEEYMFGEVPFPSVAYTEETYEHGHWWRGPTWLPMAWLMLETLEKYGFDAEAKEAKDRLYAMIIGDGRLSELFDSETGKGMGSADQSWTQGIFIKLYFELKNGELSRRYS
ncbi:MAG: hypothetical protein K6G71_06240 [Clostridiales bacterium]|nr:hypothetical protein [Clostridiales bacterium]